MKKRIFLLMTLSVLIWTKHSLAQCPSLTVSASEVCSAYNGFCGCQVSYVDLDGNLPAGYSVTNTLLTLNGSLFPAGQTNAPANNPGTLPSFYGTFPNYVLRDDFVPSGSYVLQLTMSNGSNSMTCNYPFTIYQNNAAAVPFVKTHYHTVAQLEAYNPAPTAVFYENDPITFDGTLSTETIEYNLACTHVDQYGNALGSTVTSTEYFAPELPINEYGFHNLRTLFSNLVNPSGLEFSRYYRIDMLAIGCNNQVVTGSKIIRIRIGVRPVLMRGALQTGNAQIAPNPGSGLFKVQLENAHAQVAIRVFNVEGQLVAEETRMDFSAGTMDLSHLKDGVYLMHIDAADFSTVERIVVRH